MRHTKHPLWRGLVSALVVAIDSATRIVTLKGANGKIVDVTVPPEAKKFDDIRVGDTVTAEYARALTLELKAAGGIRSSSSQAASAPAPAGAVAGGAMAKQVVIMANVTAINAKEGYITLRGPKGNFIDVMVDPSQLKLVKVGDQVKNGADLLVVDKLVRVLVDAKSQRCLSSSYTSAPSEHRELQAADALAAGSNEGELLAVRKTAEDTATCERTSAALFDVVWGPVFSCGVSQRA